MSTAYIAIKLVILPDTNDEAIATISRLSTIMTGLALEGISTEMTVTPYETEEEGTDEA